MSINTMDIKLIIFSACNFKDKIFTDSSLAAYANYLAQKHGYKTRLYTDLKNYKFLKNINYNEIEFFNEDIINNFPNRAWSLGKILAMSLVKEPFIHIDFDLLLSNNIPNNIKPNECFAFHKEYYMSELITKNSVIKLYKKYQYQNELNYDKTISTNCAIIGGQNYRIINDSCNKVIEYANLNKNFFDRFGNFFKNRRSIIFIPVFLEQILLLNLIREKTILKSIPTIIKNDNFKEISSKADELKLFHLWGNKLDLMPKINKIARDKNLSF